MSYLYYYDQDANDAEYLMSMLAMRQAQADTKARDENPYLKLFGCSVHECRELKEDAWAVITFGAPIDKMSDDLLNDCARLWLAEDIVLERVRVMYKPRGADSEETAELWEEMRGKTELEQKVLACLEGVPADDLLA